MVRIMIDFDSATNKKFFEEFFPPCYVYEIKFKGNDYLLIGEEDDGAIATQEAYSNGEQSYAYLDRHDGKVRRHNQVIGSKDDIEIIKKR